MKKTAITLLRFGLCFSLLGSVSAPVLSQEKPAESDLSKPGQMRVRITERNGKDTREIDRTYRSDGMTDSTRDALVNKLIDSLRAARKGKGGDSNISVIIEDSYRGPSRDPRRNGVVEDRYLDGDAIVGRVEVPEPVIAPLPPNAPDFDMNFRFQMDADSMRNRARRQSYEFRLQRRQMDSLSRAMQRLGRDMNRQLAPMADRLNRTFQNRDWQRDLARPFNVWTEGSQPSTVRGLDVYPNNPDWTILNVRFNAPAKGDVQIMVTNTKGKEIASRTLKDFQGEFVGQVDVGRKAEGVVFVTVTQNDDGAVRRVVLKKEAGR